MRWLTLLCLLLALPATATEIAYRYEYTGNPYDTFEVGALAEPPPFCEGYARFSLDRVCRTDRA